MRVFPPSPTPGLLISSPPLGFPFGRYLPHMTPSSHLLLAGFPPLSASVSPRLSAFPPTLSPPLDFSLIRRPSLLPPLFHFARLRPALTASPRYSFFSSRLLLLLYYLVHAFASLCGPFCFLSSGPPLHCSSFYVLPSFLPTTPWPPSLRLAFLPPVLPSHCQ